MSKPFWKSKTFYGAILTAILGVSGTADAQLPFLSAGTSETVLGVLVAISAAFTVWARSQAEGPTTLT